MGKAWWWRIAAGAVGAAGLVLSGLSGLPVTGHTASALTNCDVADYSIDGEESRLLSLINDYRSANGLGGLAVNDNLNRTAAWQVEDMGTNRRFSHTDSLHRSAYQRAIDCGYAGGAGENIAAGTNWDTAQEVFDAWKASPGHNANLLGELYHEIGIARLNVPGSPYGWYWATEFGAGSGAGSSPQPTNPPTRTPTPTPKSVTATPTPRPRTAQPTTTSAASTPTTKTRTATPIATSPARTPTRPTPPSAPSSLPLRPGANLVAWPGGDVPPAEALAQTKGSVSIVYRWDPVSRTWQRFAPGAPDFVNNIARLRHGEAYWVIATGQAQVVVP